MKPTKRQARDQKEQRAMRAFVFSRIRQQSVDQNMRLALIYESIKQSAAKLEHPDQTLSLDPHDKRQMITLFLLWLIGLMLGGIYCLFLEYDVDTRFFELVIVSYISEVGRQIFGISRQTIICAWIYQLIFCIDKPE